MKWMYFVVFCATVADQIYARPGPNEFTHSNSINVTDDATTAVVPETPSVFTKDDESIIRRYLQRLNNSYPKNIEEYDGSNNNILNNFLKTSIDDLKQNRFTSIHSTIDPDSEPSKSYQIGIPNRYYEYEINEPEPGYVNVPHNSRPQTAIFTNIKPVFELENINPYPTRYNGVVRPTFVTTPTEATLISPLYHNSPTKVTKYHLITPRPVFNVRPTHRPYVNVYGYDPSDPDPDPNYDEDYNQIDSLNFDNSYNNQPFNVKKKKKKKCKEFPTNQYDPECESFKLTLSQNVESTTAGHVIKIPNKGTSTHDNKLDLATFDEKQKDPNCSGGCCDGTCIEPYPPVPIPNRPFFPPLNPFPFPQLPLLPFPTPNTLPLPIPQQIAPIAQAPVAQTRPILSILPSLVTAGLTPLGLINKPKPNYDDDDDDFDFDFFDFDIGGSKFGFKKMMKKLWPLAPYLFALNPFSLGFWTVVISPVLLVVAGGTALVLFLYPWASKMLVHTRQSSSVVVHKHPGKRPPAPGPWRVSPHQNSGVKWTIKPKPKPFKFPQRKKRFVRKFLNNNGNEDDYGYDLMAYRYFRRFE